LLRGLGRWRAAGHDQVDAEPHQFLGVRLKLALSVDVAELKVEVLSDYVPGLAQFLEEAFPRGALV
jgi:hypothetical protein